jgi:uncharacterized membrane protein YphA (DoxX/SURF4 family)
MLGVLTRRGLASAWLERLALLALCAAYIQGGLNKLLDFPGAVAEQAHFGLAPPTAFAIATIATELGGSTLVVTGRLRWFGALWLAGFTAIATCLANQFWTLPAGADRFMMANGFFEHVGLIGGFLLVARWDLGGRWP